MKYEDPKMEAYWNSLPSEIQSVIDQAGIEICSLGMLQKFGGFTIKTENKLALVNNPAAPYGAAFSYCTNPSQHTGPIPGLSPLQQAGFLLS